MAPPLPLRFVFKAFPDEYALRLSGLSVWINGQNGGNRSPLYFSLHSDPFEKFAAGATIAAPAPRMLARTEAPSESGDIADIHGNIPSSSNERCNSSGSR